jgi:hypothetical protein
MLSVEKYRAHILNISVQGTFHIPVQNVSLNIQFFALVILNVSLVYMLDKMC